MRPKNLKTKIFLDSGNPEETKKILKIMGFLDGQTTNPSLIAKSAKGKKFPGQKVKKFYRSTVKKISRLIPRGYVSIEVYADGKTMAKEMIKEALEMYKWIPNAHIKLPITREGLKAAHELSRDGVRINLTLCFSLEQAAAVYSATKNCSLKKNMQVLISPFVGRLDDIQENGLGLVKNILRMYGQDSHVQVLAASVRNLQHMLSLIDAGTDIITAPFQVLKEWVAYKKIDLETPWKKININHRLTDAGLKKFADDWNDIIM